MKENSTNKNNEEIDLGDLFKLLKKGFEKLGNLLLRFIAFLLRNAIVLIILIIIGAVAGYFLQKKASSFVKTEMIVASDFGSAEYLFKSVKELQYKLKTQDEATIEKLGVKNSEDEFSISYEIKPIVTISRFDNQEELFLEILGDNHFLDEEEKMAMFKRNFDFYKITLFHPRGVDSQKILQNTLSILRANEYYREIYKLNLISINNQIESNEYLISQIDSLVSNYSKNTGKTSGSSSTIYNSENTLDLGVVIENRNTLQRQIQGLYHQKVTNSEFLRLIDLGNPSEIEKRGLTSYKIILIPFLLVLGYFGLIIFVKVVQKARKLD